MVCHSALKLMKTERTAVACFLILLNRVIKTVTCGYFVPLLANICLEKAWVEFTEKKGLSSTAGALPTPTECKWKVQN